MVITITTPLLCLNFTSQCNAKGMAFVSCIRASVVRDGKWKGCGGSGMWGQTCKGRFVSPCQTIQQPPYVVTAMGTLAFFLKLDQFKPSFGVVLRKKIFTFDPLSISKMRTQNGSHWARNDVQRVQMLIAHSRQVIIGERNLFGGYSLFDNLYSVLTSSNDQL